MKFLILLLLTTTLFAQEKNLTNTEYVIPMLNVNQSLNDTYIGTGLYANVVNGQWCAYVDGKINIEQKHTLFSLGVTKLINETV